MSLGLTSRSSEFSGAIRKGPCAETAAFRPDGHNPQVENLNPSLHTMRPAGATREPPPVLVRSP